MPNLPDASLKKQAERILEDVTSDPTSLPDTLSFDLFKVLCEVIQDHQPDGRGAIVVIIDGIAYVTFPDLGPLQCTIESQNALHKEQFRFVRDGRDVSEVGTRPRGWLLTALSEVRILGWWGVLVAALALPLIGIQTTADIHDYLVVITQLLAVTFVLYGIVKTGATGIGHAPSRRDFLSGNIGRLSNDEWAVGVIAVVAILLNLLGILLATPSVARWDAPHFFVVGGVTVHPVHWLLVGVIMLASVVLICFYRTLAVYYWQRSRGEVLGRAKDQYFRGMYQAHRTADPIPTMPRETQDQY
jgi:hypothetical protein